MNTIITAGTSIVVVILSQTLIRQRERKQALENDRACLCNEYINPIRFMLAENYYRVNKIARQVKETGKSKDILVIGKETDVLDKNPEWFVEDGCYLISSCYLTACLFAYMEKMRKGIPFFRISRYKDTQLTYIINKLVVDFSANLNIYYVIQMNIGKECYIKDEQRVLSYREFCELLKNKENFKWYKSLIAYYLRIGRGEYKEMKYLLVHISQLSRYLDNLVKGGDSIKQKILAEENPDRD